MATIAFTQATPVSMREQIVIVTWGSHANGDVGEPMELGHFSDRSIQVVGTFGVGGSLKVEGSNDGVNYATLNDPQGNPLVFTAAKIEAIAELTRWLRPSVTAGDGTTALVITALAKGNFR